MKHLSRAFGVATAAGVVMITVGFATAAQKPTSASVSTRKIVALTAPAFEISPGIRMVRIEKGTFSMGSPESEPGRGPDETPHRVTIHRPFYMAETEITQGQYLPLMLPGYTPFFAGTGLPETHSGGPFNTRNAAEASRQPIEGVTWAKAVEFCEKLTERERQAGRLPKGYIYRLPTEAEWEYACRAGTSGTFNVAGAVTNFAVAGSNLDAPRPVKTGRQPNAWGLYDLHGNVYEWCLDWYGPYASGSATDPAGPATGELKVARGGCYLTGRLEGRAPDVARDQAALRSAARAKFDPEFPLGILGFRPVLAPVVER